MALNTGPTCCTIHAKAICATTFQPTPTTMYLGGVMHYIELDVNNLCRWFTGAIGASGANAMNTTGYVVYFSDRRTE